MAQKFTSPALSEQADVAVMQSRPDSSRGHTQFQMSLVAADHHYFRNGTGTEKVYDLRNDPSERSNLVGSPLGDEAVGTLRRILLQVLNDNPGSSEVEAVYLKAYRQELNDLVQQSSTPRHDAGP